MESNVGYIVLFYKVFTVKHKHTYSDTDKITFFEVFFEISLQCGIGGKLVDRSICRFVKDPPEIVVVCRVLFIDYIIQVIECAKV